MKNIKHITINDVNDIFYCGDIHGAFEIFAEMNLQPNSLIVVCGDFGVGFSSKKNVNKHLRILNENCKKLNTKLAVVRGNHDNPEYFNGKYLKKHSNIMLIPDYTILTVNNINILCIGGNVSIDRSKRTEGKSYWTDEIIEYSEHKLRSLKEYLESNKIKLHTIASHCSPIYRYPVTPYSDSFNDDSDLSKDVQNEIFKMNKIVRYIRDEIEHDLKYIVFGHYHIHSDIELCGTQYISLSIRELIKHVENNDTTKAKNEKKQTR